ncbi:hypothetical protein HY030_01600 [Candidatus Gottesmanbacteria bacterium]|nr:hypothetical protein [Candidatus Gottesmanbacteria bacterium]
MKKKPHQVIKELFLIVLVALIFILPILWSKKDLAFRLDIGDYDQHLPIYYYIVEQIRDFHRFPLWHPYVQSGISILGDPLSSTLNPLFMVPLIIFGVDHGMKVVFVMSIVIAGIAMWILLSYLGVYTVPQKLDHLLR